jgi:hypothetical protein
VSIRIFNYYVILFIYFMVVILYHSLQDVIFYIFSRDVTTLMSSKCHVFYGCGHDGMIDVQVLVSWLPKFS